MCYSVLYTPIIYQHHQTINSIICLPILPNMLNKREKIGIFLVWTRWLQGTAKQIEFPPNRPPSNVWSRGGGFRQRSAWLTHDNLEKGESSLLIGVAGREQGQRPRIGLNHRWTGKRGDGNLGSGCSTFQPAYKNGGNFPRRNALIERQEGWSSHEQTTFRW